MNLPGRPAGNWAWRVRWEQLEDWRLERLAEWTQAYGRSGEQGAADPGAPVAAEDAARA